MALASGYTQLEYIQSSGTQYIDTGFIPKGDSRVVMDFNASTPETVVALFGARAGMSSNAFAMWLESEAVQTQYGSVAYNTKPISATSYNARQTYDLNKGVATVGSTSVTFSQLSFNSGYNLILFGLNASGTADNRRASGKLYGAKVYDNGTLVRDFIPCKNASGTIGLWDDVNSAFYANAGSGTFIAGEIPKGTHRTLIAGTGYDIKSGRVLIAGTGYDIKKGRTLIDGTGYDIKFSTPLAELAEGTIIKINESGSPVEFYIAKHNYESDLNGTGKTLVVRKECWNDLVVYATRGDSGYTDRDYVNSKLRSWLNSTYLSKLSTFVQDIIATTKYHSIVIEYDQSRTDEAAVFALSLAEFGYSHSLGSYAGPSEGTELPIASTLRVATRQGAACEQWTRTCVYEYNSVHYLTTSGSYDYKTPDDDVLKGARPVFTLLATAEVDSDLILIES